MGILKRLLTLLGFKLLYNHSIIFINKWLHSFSAAPQPQLMRWAWGLKGWDMLQVCRESCPGNFKAEQRCSFKADVCCLSYLAGNRSGAVLRDTWSEPPALLPSGSSDLQKPLTCVTTFCQREPEVCAGKAGVTFLKWQDEYLERASAPGLTSHPQQVGVSACPRAWGSVLPRSSHKGQNSANSLESHRGRTNSEITEVYI